MTVNSTKVEKWGVFEVELHTESVFDNPFADVKLYARFSNKRSNSVVDGFYDGNGVFRIRFMPSEEGEYRYVIYSSCEEFNNSFGCFECIPAGKGNHGPAVIDKKHFSYADGNPCFIMGTTAYAWTYMKEEMRNKTLESFQKYGFNKVRMLVFPKYLAGFEAIDLTHEPPVLPYEGTKNQFDYKRFNVQYFKNFEERVKDLMKLGIEADVILFHNYDFGFWGIDEGMNDDDAEYYLKYIISRIASFRNVWWSLANEYDLCKDADGTGVRYVFHRRDWDRLGRFVMEKDPYDHPRSIHNCGSVYPDRPWITHASCQSPNTYSLLVELKARTGKPAVNDEYKYEGNLPYEWGNKSGVYETVRHWMSVMAGSYATHGECYVVDGNKKDIFWTYGGEMVGESAERLRYLKDIVETLPFQKMQPDLCGSDGLTIFKLNLKDEAYLFFLTEECTERAIYFGGERDTVYEVTIFDVWNCSIVRQFESTGEYRDYKVPGMIAIKVVEKGV